MSGTATVRRQDRYQGITPRVTARIPAELITAAKNANPELKDADNSLLLRIALALLAGFTVKSALDYLGQQKPGSTIKLPQKLA
jgi:hypothetical protein